MRLLEKRHVEQTYYDGAQLNNFIAQGGAGRVFGLKLSHTSQQILISAGLLIVRGYRVSFDNETLLSFDSYPVQNETANLILRITTTQDDSSATITTGPLTNMDEIEKDTGVYDYLLATFIVGPEGIKEITSQIRDLKSSGDKGGIGSVLGSRNMSESDLISLMLTLDDGIYEINTQLYGDEFLFVQKNGQQIARYTGTGESYSWHSQNNGWVLAAGGSSGGGTVWLSGTEITGTGENILSYDMTLYGKCKVGDMYRNNDTQNTYTCIYKDNEKTAWQYESSIRGLTGNAVFIKYSSYPDGTNFTAEWDSSKAYMGVYIGTQAPTDKTEYTWTKFIGNYVDIVDDATTKSITHNLVDNTDKTYSADNITKLTVNIPSAMYHGFYAGLNFKVSEAVPEVEFANDSTLPLKLIQFGLNAPSYTPSANCTVVMAFFCDGINLYGYINEVS